MKWKHVFLGLENLYQVSLEKIISCFIFKNWKGSIKKKAGGSRGQEIETILVNMVKPRLY